MLCSHSPLRRSKRALSSRSSYDLSVGRIAGGIVGFAVAIIFTEVVFRNAEDTAPLGMTAILIVLGVFAGSRVALHFRKGLS